MIMGVREGQERNRPTPSIRIPDKELEKLKEAATHLPELPADASTRLYKEMERGEENVRTQVHNVYKTYCERTLEEKISSEVEGKIEVGKKLIVVRRIRRNGEEKLMEETFEIEKKLSSERNISGDVYLAKKYWNNEFYGRVILKTPKATVEDDRDRIRLYKEFGKEIKNLDRFEGNHNILHAAGMPFAWNSEPVIQMEYQPWSIFDYISYLNDETAITAGVISVAIQCLNAIECMKNKIDGEGPNGYAHVDLKAEHVRLDYRKNKNGEGEWVLIIIDLDSIVPAGEIPLNKLKYNGAYVDPEKFMRIEEDNIRITAEPAEAIYSLGLILLHIIAKKTCDGLRKRAFRPVVNSDNGAQLIDKEAMRKEIERVRMIDELNFLKVYYSNKVKRILEGRFDQDPEPLKDFLARSNSYPEAKGVRGDAVAKQIGNRNEMIHPNVFVGIMECLRPRSERKGADALKELFERLWEEYARLSNLFDTSK